MPTTLTLDVGAQLIELDPKCLLVFIDETGHEEYSDPKNRLFGLGGCAVRADHYQQLIEVPWTYMKDKWFGGSSARLRACEMRPPRKDQPEAMELFRQQVEALGHYFARFQICRLAAVSHHETKHGGFVPYELVAMMCIKQIANSSRSARRCATGERLLSARHASA